MGRTSEAPEAARSGLRLLLCTGNRYVGQGSMELEVFEGGEVRVIRRVADTELRARIEIEAGCATRIVRCAVVAEEIPRGASGKRRRPDDMPYLVGLFAPSGRVKAWGLFRSELARFPRLLRLVQEVSCLGRVLASASWEIERSC